ncbi:hypothetical protein DVH26_18250 [Paenibacillus sp. H1-7]|uniref:Ig-like domain-containing protein n=1 Tax=Paenibacillus sp. H1-7 TaxID=2282849 RepID=UPI001EF7A16B|nr:Ig-like domain-containing protein [Paenibacillus sp. H1-7]ULL16215.1 hypothetical protein DVH26_18250 [Paenibacillus sp. H1-7]
MRVSKLACASLLSISVLASSVPVMAADLPAVAAAIPAFPGAEGGGMYTTGGRGGSVYEVTNLNDSGPGSLRDAVSQGNRTVVFRVSGNIELESPLNITGSNITIAGQTAPGDGISVNNHSTYVKADNVIIRYMRFRMGDETPSAGDAMTIDKRKNLIIDHCSVTWAIDEVLSPQDTDNLTVQWSIVGEALHMSKHEKGRHGFGGLWGAGNNTYHHNILVHNSSRNPRFKGRTEEDKRNLDYRNNVVYNWNYKTAYGGGSANVNMINNYNKYGPDTVLDKRDLVLDELGVNGQWYIDGNYIDGSPTVTADNWAGVFEFTPTNTRLGSPVPFAPVTTHTPEQAYELVLAQAGAILPKRDSVDARIIQDIRNRTGRQINSPTEVGGWPDLKSAPAPADTDHDGMPDEWELARGLDPANPDDRNGDMDSDGYTNLEHYLNGIVGSGSQNPVVRIASPATNTITGSGSTMVIDADASDPDGSIQKVEFYQNGVKLGEDTTAPYQYTWANVPEGTFFLTAKAIDNTGTSTDSYAVPVHSNATGGISPWSEATIGTPGLPGHSNMNDGVLTLKSAGNIAGPGNDESFHYVYQKLQGDGQLIARIDKITHTAPLAKAGVMIREKLTPGARMGMTALAVRGDGHVAEFYSRETEGGALAETPPLPSINPPYYVRIVKFGKTVTGYISLLGNDWSSIGSMQLDSDEVYIGLMADAGKENNLIENYNKSMFSQIQFEKFPELPYKATNVSVSRGESDLLLSWSPAERATAYQVRRSLTPGGPYTTIATVADTKYLDTTAEAGVNYFYVVRATNSNGESLENSEERNGALLGTPAAVYLINEDFENMTVGSHPEGFDSRPTPNTDANRVIVDNVPAIPAGNASSKLMNLADNSTSQTRASKTFPAQKGVVIAEASVMQTEGADYPRVLRLNDVPFGKSYIELFSGYGAGCPTAYCFYYRKSDDSNGKAAPLPANNEFVPNKWYKLKVIADVKTQLAEVFINGTSAGVIPFHKSKGWPDAPSLSAVDFLSSATHKVNEYLDDIRVGIPAIQAPAGVTAAVYGTSASVNWDAVPDATSYRVYRSEGSGRYTLVASDLKELSYKDQGLAYDQTYTYSIAAVNNTVEGAYSAPATVRTLSPLIIHLDQQSGSVSTVVYTITGSLNRPGQVFVNGKEAAVQPDLKFSYPVRLIKGVNDITVEAVDAAGDKAVPVKLQIVYDTTTPVVTVTNQRGHDNGKDDKAEIGDYLITGKISEPGTVTADGRPATVKPDLTYSVVVTLKQGRNRITIQGVDLAGNHSVPVVWEVVATKKGNDKDVDPDKD